MSNSSPRAMVSFIIPKSRSTIWRDSCLSRPTCVWRRAISLSFVSDMFPSVCRVSLPELIGHLDREPENKKARDLDPHLIFDLGQDTLTVFLFAEIKDADAEVFGHL